MILEHIEGPWDVKNLSPEELKTLAAEIRQFLIEKISVTGGHLASNLGVVELTIALYLAFDLPRDKVIWDVGHQSYTHKILSGRREMFDELRQYGGMSGFPKRKESPYDSFDTGHSSTSISAGLGIAQGRDLLGEDYAVISVIGDGALTGGMAYEALNNAAQIKKNFIIVLNDNGAVYQKNNEALRLLGLEVFTHVRQLSRVDAHLTDTLTACRPGDKFQAAFGNERGTVNLSVRVSDITVRQEHLRILALNDINNELDEKEIDSWIRLTRVLTHEIMNAVTPITSLSDTLLKLTEARISKEEMRHGLQTISTTGKGLLAFVESYRRFTRIPTPEPSLFYLKGFINRMAELARHQYPDTPVTFNVSIVPDDLILYADENLISQVIINLLKNAIQAFETGAPAATGTNAETTAETNAATTEKHINIRAYCNEAEAVLIEISNNGPAIPPDIAGHIFIPFFTTKENGSGIGLSISRQIMRLSGGSLSLIAGKETTFVLKFN